MYIVSHFGKNTTQFIETGQSAKDENIYETMEGILKCAHAIFSILTNASDYEQKLTETMSSQLLLNAVTVGDVDTVSQLLAAGYPNIEERRPNIASSDDGYTS